MTRGIFITGTDTGVGKTYVGAGIASALVSQGIDVGVMKPAETGCGLRKGVLMPRDTLRLMKAAQVDDGIDLVNPYRFRLPLAPAVAAQLSGRTIDIAKIMQAFRTLAQSHRFMIVEGAGGIMVPLSGKKTYLDLAVRMKLPVLVVARPNLGTINHTTLTIMALQGRRVSIAGIVCSDAGGTKRGPAERTNPGAIERLTGLPVLGSIGYGERDLSPVARAVFCRLQSPVPSIR
jgi:dethiobiotin synthetase